MSISSHFVQVKQAGCQAVLADVNTATSPTSKSFEHFIQNCRQQGTEGVKADRHMYTLRSGVSKADKHMYTLRSGVSKADQHMYTLRSGVPKADQHMYTEVWCV